MLIAGVEEAIKDEQKAIKSKSVPDIARAVDRTNGALRALWPVILQTLKEKE
jgi:hypothetical protein